MDTSLGTRRSLDSDQNSMRSSNSSLCSCEANPSTTTSPAVVAASGSATAAVAVAADAQSTCSSSSSGEGQPLCRICLLGDDKQPLLEPCNCRGSIGSVHQECLERWISRTANGKCQICQFQFKVQRRSLPVRLLFKDPVARRGVLIYLGLGAVFSLSIAFIFSLAWLYALRLASCLGDRAAALLVILLALQNVVWHYFPFLCFTYAFEAIKKWRRENTVLRVILDPPDHPTATGAGPQNTVQVCVS
ncbi:E3 ubiquitin-protein ligase MARCHF2-like [Ornithodoros turicata]|uniref:E3 ubiquitin-protein ligase MARCHF2-like n=1 Tax=Ornithodoros turicata TaxID=34597 RepID=UPI003138D1B3